VTDRRLLFATAFVRALSVGMIGVLLGLYLAALPLDAAHIGIVVAAGLAGGAVASLLVTLGGDRLGRRRTLMLLAVATAVGGIALAFFHDFVTLTIAAFLGMANGMGRDRGAALVIEQAILPATVEDNARTQTFAWYNVLQDAGHALGSLAAAAGVLQTAADLAPTAALRSASAALALVTAGFYLRLSPTASGARACVARHARRLGKLSLRTQRARGRFLYVAALVLLRDPAGASAASAASSSCPGANAPRICRRLARSPDRPRQHDGLHPHPSSLFAVRCPEPSRRGDAVPVARGPRRDGRPDAHFLRDGGRAPRGAQFRVGRDAPRPRRRLGRGARPRRMGRVARRSRIADPRRGDDEAR
jgi:MFS family permease